MIYNISILCFLTAWLILCYSQLCLKLFELPSSAWILTITLCLTSFISSLQVFVIYITCRESQMLLPLSWYTWHICSYTFSRFAYHLQVKQDSMALFSPPSLSPKILFAFFAVSLSSKTSIASVIEKNVNDLWWLSLCILEFHALEWKILFIPVLFSLYFSFPPQTRKTWKRLLTLDFLEFYL